MGGLFYVGLKYSSLPEVERRLAPEPDVYVPDDRALFRQLQLLEREALQHLNQRD